MKHFITTAVFGATLMLTAPQVFAATLGLTTGLPSVTSNSATTDYIEFGARGDFSSFGSAVTSTDGITLTGPGEIGFGVGFDLSTPTVGADGGFNIVDNSGEFLAGDLLAVGFTTNSIELQFGNLTGSGAGGFGTSVLALISFDTALGANPFADFKDGAVMASDITIANIISPIPLPAGLPLMLTGLGLVAVLKRRR